jgi:hypothetical protein
MLKSDRWIRLPALFDPAGVVCSAIHRIAQEWINQPPAELLNQFLGIDLTGQAVLNDDLELLNRRLDEMEASAREK